MYAARLDGSDHNGSIFVHNTINNIHKGILFEDNGSSIAFALQNNIFVCNGGYFSHSGTTGRFTVSHNLFQTDPTPEESMPYYNSPGRVVGNPKFANDSFVETTLGHQLIQESDGLLAGTSSSLVSVDYKQAARNASTPSMGMFEAALTGCVWTGLMSNDWNDYRNWDCEVPPGENMDINVGTTFNNPVISSGNVSCRNLQLDIGASIYILGSATLTVYSTD